MGYYYTHTICVYTTLYLKQTTYTKIVILNIIHEVKKPEQNVNLESHRTTIFHQNWK
jgi:hypothetical protein